MFRGGGGEAGLEVSGHVLVVAQIKTLRKRRWRHKEGAELELIEVSELSTVDYIKEYENKVSLKLKIDEQGGVDKMES